jgi:hypothetical protein
MKPLMKLPMIDCPLLLFGIYYSVLEYRVNITEYGYWFTDSDWETQEDEYGQGVPE